MAQGQHRKNQATKNRRDRGSRQQRTSGHCSISTNALCVYWTAVVVVFGLFSASRVRSSVDERQQKRSLPGLAEGSYLLLNGATCVGCAHRIFHQCGHNIINDSIPFDLRVPGRLGDRTSLSEVSLCVLWYLKSFWTRSTGGGRGLLLFRFGGVDDKERLLRNIERYERKHGCRSFQVIPPTVDLSNPKSCLEFYDNRSSRRLSDGLWFMKHVQGSQGTHISLLRPGREAASAAAAANATVLCPRKYIASLNVEEPMLLNERKFDNRVYLLIASLKPLLVMVRPGHLRVSALRYNASQPDPPLAMHITNPSFGLALEQDSSRIIRPVTELFEILKKRYGTQAGDKAWRAVQRSIRRALLQVRKYALLITILAFSFLISK